MQNKLKNKKSGFTLIETLIGVAIFVLILGVLATFSKSIWTSNSFIMAELEGSNTGRAALKTMVAEIRTASSGNNGAYAIATATSTSIIFYSDIYNDGLKEKIRYYLSGLSLMKGVTIPSGSPLQYISNTEIVTEIINNIRNGSTPIFTYYDSSYNGTTSPLAQPVSILAVRLVKITLILDTDPNKPPASITVTTEVSMRNLKDNL